MKKRLAAFCLALILLLAFPAAAYGLPLPLPSTTVNPWNMVVDVPDDVLNSRLHLAAGVAISEPLRWGDLMSIGGSLALSDCGIRNAEGIQYCANVERLWLGGNALTTMPDLAGMVKLVLLNLDANDLTSVPSGVCKAPQLKELSLRNNPIRSANSLGSLAHLKILYMENCALASFPSALLPLGIEKLYLDGNPIGALPEDISRMASLRTLTLEDCDLTALPPSICGMTLETLNVSRNGLYGLPEGIGTHVEHLLASGNRISSIPDSLLGPGAISRLNLAMNRLTSLPQRLTSKRFDELNLRFNFLDISAGSATRAILDVNPTIDKRYDPQLKLPVVSAQAASDSVTLSWTPGAGGSSSDGCTWEVKGYVVYQYVNGEMVSLAELNGDARSFTHEGLTPETAYSYRVGVDYYILYSIFYASETRGYGRADATTLAAPDASVSPPENTAAAQPANPAQGQKAFSTATVICICVGGVLLVAAVMMAILLKKRKNKETPE